MIVGGAVFPLGRETFDDVTLIGASSATDRAAIMPWAVQEGRIRLGPMMFTRVGDASAPAPLLAALREDGYLKEATATARALPAVTPPEKLQSETVVTLACEGANKAATLTAEAIELATSWRGVTPGDGGFALLSLAWENRLPYQVVKEELQPVAYQITNLAEHLFLRADGRFILALDPADNPIMEQTPDVFLPGKGSRRELRLAYRMPRMPLLSLELVYLDSHYGHMTVPLWGAPPSDVTFAHEPAANPYLAFGVAGVRESDKIADARAPAGKTFVVVELAGKSEAQGTVRGQAAAFLVRFEPARYTQLVEEEAYAVSPAVVPLPYGFAGESPFLPTVFNHGYLAFAVPKEHGRLALHVFMPAKRQVTSGELEEAKLDTLVIPLEGEAKPVPAITDPLPAIADGDLLEVVAGKPVRQGGDLHVDVAVKSTSATPEIFRPFEQVLAGVKGRQVAADAPATALAAHPAEPFVRIPPGSARRFTLVFRDAAEAASLLYRGFTRGATVPLAVKPDTTTVATAPPKPAALPLPATDETPKPPDAGGPPIKVVEKGTCTAVKRGDAPAWLQEHRGGWINLASVNLGTTLAVAGTTIKDPRHVVELHDDEIDDYSYFEPKSTFTFELLGGREASVASVALCLGTRAGEASITCEGATAEGPFEVLAAANTTERRECLYVLDFNPATVSRVRFGVESPQSFYIRELLAFERPYDDPSSSALSRGGLDIAQRGNGACFMYSEIDYAHGLAECLNGSVNRHATVYRSKGRTAPIVLAFKANQEALVASIGIQCRLRSEKPEPESLPTAIRVHASRTDPFRDFTLAGEFTVERRAEEQVFPLPAPVWARFLKFEFDLPPAETSAEFSRLSVYEGTEPGYASVFVRGQANLARQSARTVTIDELLGGAALTDENEPNGEPSQAAACSLGRWYGGSLGLGDTDLVAFTHGNQDEIPMLDLHMVPFLRGRVQVLDSQGTSVHEIDVAKAGGTTLRTALPLPPGDYYLAFSSADTYVLLGFDTSGSMSGTFKTTGVAMTSWATKLPPGFAVALATSLEDRKTGKQFTLFCPFTKDPAAITAAVAKLFTDGGGSDWYTVLGDLLEYTDTTVPTDAMSAVVYLADGNGSGRYDWMWKNLRQTRARVYSIGFGDVGRALDSTTSWDGARGLFNVAWYRSGRYFEPHTTEELVAVYDAIFQDLRAAPRYALQFTTRKRMTGTLVTEAPRGEKRPILFILDASGSMMQEIRGTTRLAIAKEVIARFVQALPPDSEIGLRVYGHRYPTIDRESARRDSELLVPVGPLDRERFLATVRRLRARGGTPFAYSLQEAMNDVSRTAKPRVICVTDGIESFGGDPAAAAAALKKAAPQSDIAIVGFAIGEEGAQANLRQVAEAAQGLYFSAADAQSLVDSVENALNPRIPYTVLDRQGRLAARGVFGDRHTLKEGPYRLVVPAAGSDLMLDVRIDPDRETLLPVPKEARPAAVAAGPPAVTETPSPATKPPPTAPKFCTQCGKRLLPGANFCTGCGAKIKK